MLVLKIAKPFSNCFVIDVDNQEACSMNPNLKFLELRRSKVVSRREGKWKRCLRCLFLLVSRQIEVRGNVTLVTDT